MSPNSHTSEYCLSNHSVYTITMINEGCMSVIHLSLQYYTTCMQIFGRVCMCNVHLKSWDGVGNNANIIISLVSGPSLPPF